MRHAKQIATLCLTVLLACTAAARAADEEETNKTKLGDAVPNFTITTLDGRTLTPASLKGKVVLINFFATWCGPCVAEMPHLQKQVHERFKDEPNFVMVSVAREQTEADVKPFIAQHKLTFPFAIDPKREAYALFATKYIPRNYVIGADGKILYQHVGFSDAELTKMVDKIEKALAASRAPAAATAGK
jgi:peroxiredoxin